MKGISLPAVLQVIDLERQSCSIEATSNDYSGQLHFSNGMLVHAATGSLMGEDAAYEILSWPDPDYHMETAPFSGDPTLQSNIQQLLLESARRYDESQRSPGKPNLSPPGNNGGNGSGAGGTTHPAAVADHAPAVAPGAQPSAGQPVTAPPAAAVQGLAGTGARMAGLDTAGLQTAIEAAQAALNGALVAADVCLAADGTSIVAYNSLPAACALFNQIATQMDRSLPRSNLPGLGRYLLAELADNQTVLFASAGSYQLCLVVDTSQIQLGMLLNLVLPEMLACLEAVQAG